MSRFIKIAIVSMILTCSGCGGPLRNAALQAHEESNRIYQETVTDLYNMNVTGRLALVKAQINAAVKDGTINDKVTVVDKSGKTAVLSRGDALLNSFAQAMVDSAMLKVNAARADGFADEAWIYIQSRAGFIETAIEDLRVSREASKTKNVLVTTTLPG